MHYYQFNIGDYKSHTAHLDPIEDIAYRRMLDWYYLHEKPLPKQIEEIARLINMRTHCDSIATVLKEFFTYKKDVQGWYNKRASENIESFLQKSEKAKNSAKARWNKVSEDANALRTHCEGNANHKPLTINQETDIVLPNGNTGENTVSTGNGQVPIKLIVDKWNSLARSEGLPQAVKVTTTIKGQIRQRWKDIPSLAQWDNFFEAIRINDFLSGRAPPGVGRSKPFRATLLWITKETNFAKIAAGEYD